MNDLSTVDGMKDCSKKDSFIVRAMPGRSFIHSFIHSMNSYRKSENFLRRYATLVHRAIHTWISTCRRRQTFSTTTATRSHLCSDHDHSCAWLPHPPPHQESPLPFFAIQMAMCIYIFKVLVGIKDDAVHKRRCLLAPQLFFVWVSRCARVPSWLLAINF